MIGRNKRYHWYWLLVLLLIMPSCKAEQTKPEKTPIELAESADPNIWIFMMAGQSNMAGRATIESQDVISNHRIIAINNKNQWIEAKEPLHFYEPNAAGLDCGMTFARKLLKHVPDSVTIALVPCAVGGSSVFQWLNNEEHRGITLLSNFNQKVDLAKKKGVIKGIIWHQGERNANAEGLPGYKDALLNLFRKFRTIIQTDNPPIVMGELGRFAEPKEKAVFFSKMNTLLGQIAVENDRLFLVTSEDLDHRGDNLHFNSSAQRELGNRYAEIMLKQLINK